MQFLYQESGHDTRADGANYFFERLDIQQEGLQKNEISDICVLLGKLMFNIQRYF